MYAHDKIVMNPTFCIPYIDFWPQWPRQNGFKMAKIRRTLIKSERNKLLEKCRS